jgi:hypothetical protein
VIQGNRELIDPIVAAKKEEMCEFSFNRLRHP